jgi:hypothetical protein
MLYDVEGWVILKYTIASEEFYYRIFASWRDDSWRLSSGSKELPKLSPCKKLWLWSQISGSCYKLPLNEEGGYTFYTGSILSRIINRSGEDATLIEKVELATLQKSKNK